MKSIFIHVRVRKTLALPQESIPRNILLWFESNLLWKSVVRFGKSTWSSYYQFSARHPRCRFERKFQFVIKNRATLSGRSGRYYGDYYFNSFRGGDQVRHACPGCAQQTEQRDLKGIRGVDLRAAAWSESLGFSAPATDNTCTPPSMPPTCNHALAY